MIADAQHAALSEQLHALVVAIGAAARIVDVDQHPGRRPQRHHRGIDVAGASDRRIDQRIAEGGHRDDLAGDEARDVEIMDGHVAEQAAGHRDVAERRRRRVAAGDDQLFEPADLALLRAPPQSSDRRIEAALEADHDGRRERCDLVAAAFGAREIEIDRFLAQHRLAGPGRRDDQVDMGVGRAGDQHRVDARIVEHVGHRERLSHVMRPRDRGGRIGHDVVDGEQAGVRMARQVGGVHPSDPAAAQYSEIHHRPAPVPGLSRPSPCTRRHCRR